MISCQLQVSPVRAVDEPSSPEGSFSRSIYATGSAYFENELYKPILWVNGNPTLLPIPAGKTEGRTYALQIASGTIYIAGDVMDSEGIKYPCIWTFPIGSEPTEPFLLPLPTNHVGGDPALTTLFIENGDVYAAGVLVDLSDLENPQRKLCYWKNNASPTFPNLPESFSMGSVGFGGLSILNGVVYIAGVANSETYSVPYLWKNETPHPLALPNGINEGRVYGITFANGFLYLAGHYIDGSSGIPCYWRYNTSSENSSSIPLSGYTSNTSNFAIVPFTDGSNVYMGGGLGIPNEDGWTPPYWKNGTPIPVPFPQALKGGLVVSLTIKDGIVYVAGFYGDPEGIGSEAFIWKGATKLTVHSPAGSGGTQIY
ncbi:MAG: hypothetical protein N2442_12245, partial [Spirochaetes bacterium]|nr:hypothetical protein [Spirochaetota bacterium]